MKIGILTYFNDLNFGTNVQALSSLNVLKKYYPKDSVEIVPFTNFKVRKLPYITNASLGSLIKDLWRIRHYNHFRKEKLGIKRFYLIRDWDKAIEYIKNQHYDKIYIGADTVLELFRYKDKSTLSPYWLTNDFDSDIYIAAASVRDSEFEALNDLQKKAAVKLSQKYKLIGARDEATMRFFLSIPGFDSSKLHLIPDPTFAFDGDINVTERYFEKKNINPDDRLICIRPTKKDTWEREFVKIAHDKGFKVVSMRPSKYVDYTFNDISAEEQMCIYSKFKVTVSHLFHEGVFSIKNGTPTVLYPISQTMANSNGESKYSSLLKDFNLLESSFISDINIINARQLFDVCINAMNDFDMKRETIKKKCEDNKTEYLRFIEKTLGNEQ